MVIDHEKTIQITNLLIEVRPLTVVTCVAANGWFSILCSTSSCLIVWFKGKQNFLYRVMYIFDISHNYVQPSLFSWGKMSSLDSLDKIVSSAELESHINLVYC